MTFQTLVTAAPSVIRGPTASCTSGVRRSRSTLHQRGGVLGNPHAVFFAGFSPDVIETANVMIGGFPAENGNRFGVVDIVTKSGLRMDHGLRHLNAGEAGRRNVLGSSADAAIASATTRSGRCSNPTAFSARPIRRPFTTTEAVATSSFNSMETLAMRARFAPS
jgi:hypothetical protein